jgi:hypothetical protein
MTKDDIINEIERLRLERDNVLAELLAEREAKEAVLEEALARERVESARLRAERKAPDMPYVSRDYYWQGKPGAFYTKWEIWKKVGDKRSRVGGLSFWRMRTAARVCNEIFAAYIEGRKAERLDANDHAEP